MGLKITHTKYTVNLDSTYYDFNNESESFWSLTFTNTNNLIYFAIYANKVINYYSCNYYSCNNRLEYGDSTQANIYQTQHSGYNFPNPLSIVTLSISCLGSAVTVLTSVSCLSHCTFFAKKRLAGFQ